MNQTEFKIENRIAYITLNRPEKRNALGPQMVTELKQCFKKAEESDEAKVIVLQANGDVFCAGADLAYLKQLQENSFEENLADSNHLKELFDLIYRLKKVVIAKINGHAIAGGCGLAAVCDFSFAVPQAQFGYTEVRIGFVPALVSVFLLRKIGEGRAKQLLLSGELVAADEAKGLGLINFIVDAQELDSSVEQFAQTLIKKNSSESMAMTKRLIGEVQSMSLEDGLNYSANLNAEARATSDCQKGIASFLSKEKPIW